MEHIIKISTEDLTIVAKALPKYMNLLTDPTMTTQEELEQAPQLLKIINYLWDELNKNSQ